MRTLSPCSPTGRGAALKTREMGVRNPPRALATPGRSRFLRVAPVVVPAPVRGGNRLAMTSVRPKSFPSGKVRTRRVAQGDTLAFGEHPAGSEARYLGDELAIRRPVTTRLPVPVTVQASWTSGAIGSAATGYRGRVTKNSNEYMNEYMKRRYKQRRRLAIEELGGECVRCGSPKNLEFHHVDPKSKSITIAKGSSMSKKRWDAEIAKCHLLCRPCHRSEHRVQNECGDMKKYWQGCRCNACKAAASARNKAYNKRKKLAAKSSAANGSAA